MLQISRQFEARAAGPTDVSLTEIAMTCIGVLRRHLLALTIIVASTFLIGVLYLLTTPAMYAATATIVIDTRKGGAPQPQENPTSVTPIDPGSFQTEMEILKSENVSNAVIKNLRLTDDPEFVSPRAGLISSIVQKTLGLFHGSQSPPTEGQLQRNALSVFGQRETVERFGLSYVMQVSFLSLNPDKAARIANALAEAYISDGLESKFQATRRASLWMQDRLADLHSQASAADRAVVEFKQAHNINTADGKLMNEQQMSQVNSQLILAQASTAEAKARLDRITQIMKQPIPDASVTEALNSGVIVSLRNSYLELAGKEAILSAKVGPNHQATISLRTQMGELRKNIADQMGKIAEGYKSDYAIAQAREESIKASLGSAVSENHTTNQAEIELRALSATAESYHRLIDGFLRRNIEAVQQESFPISEARLITPATGGVRTQPVPVKVFAASIFGGLFLSALFAFVREFFDDVFRTGRQVSEKLQTECLAMLPKVDRVAPGNRGQASDVIGRVISTENGMLRHVLDEPFSHFTEALRAVKVAADAGKKAKGGKVIGFTSALPNEGKSTASCNFAQMLAHAGNVVLLIDSDLRNPTLSRAIASGSRSGLADVVRGKVAVQDVIWGDPISKLCFIPAVGADAKLHHTNEILGSKQMHQLIAAIREKFDYVVLDLPPLTPVVDTRTTTGFIDSYVCVVEWGKTKIDVVEHSLSEAREVHDRLLGVILNKIDLASIGSYERHRKASYYRRYYERYGYTS